MLLPSYDLFPNCSPVVLGFTSEFFLRRRHLVHLACISGRMANEAQQLVKEEAQKLLNPLTRLEANLDKNIAKRYKVGFRMISTLFQADREWVPLLKSKDRA